MMTIDSTPSLLTEAGLCSPATAHLLTNPTGNQGFDWEPGRAICNRCPVHADCLLYALEHRVGDDAMYGGHTPKERRAMARSGNLPLF